MINARAPKSSPILNAVVVMENSAGYRKWGGNQGYQDSPGKDYAFDSTVHLACETQLALCSLSPAIESLMKSASSIRSGLSVVSKRRFTAPNARGRVWRNQPWASSPVLDTCKA